MAEGGDGREGDCHARRQDKGKARRGWFLKETRDYWHRCNLQSKRDGTTGTIESVDRCRTHYCTYSSCNFRFQKFVQFSFFTLQLLYLYPLKCTTYVIRETIFTTINHAMHAEASEGCSSQLDNSLILYKNQ